MSKLLLIEDDAAFANTLARRLTKSGFDVSHAIDSSEALLLARHTLPDAILLDMHLDGDSGLKLITPLRNVLPKARIVLLTGYASIATAVEAIKLGADDYLAKPADIESIIRALNSTSVIADCDQEKVLSTLSAERAEWEHIQQVLKANDGNVSAAARHLSMHRRTLQRKLKKRPSFSEKH